MRLWPWKRGPPPKIGEIGPAIESMMTKRTLLLPCPLSCNSCTGTCTLRHYDALFTQGQISSAAWALDQHLVVAIALQWPDAASTTQPPTAERWSCSICIVVLGNKRHLCLFIEGDEAGQQVFDLMTFEHMDIPQRLLNACFLHEFALKTRHYCILKAWQVYSNRWDSPDVVLAMDLLKGEALTDRIWQKFLQHQEFHQDI